MSKKAIVLSLYIIAILLLIILPVNDKDSVLNKTNILSLRADYFCHALLFSPWMSLRPTKTFGTSILHWFMIGIFLAGFSECIQYFLPYRSFNINDVMANIAGTTLGLLSYLFFRKT